LEKLKNFNKILYLEGKNGKKTCGHRGLRFPICNHFLVLDFLT